MLACTAVLAAACTSPPSPEGLSSAATTGIPAGAGVIIGSIARTSDELGFDLQKVLLKEAATGRPYVITLAGRPTSPFVGESEINRIHFREPLSVGQVFSLSLPPGQYVAYQYEFARYANPFRAYGGESRTWKAARDFALPVQVKPGRATYIGELKLETITSTNAIGLVRFDDGRWVVSDQSRRDLPLLTARLPQLVQFPVDVALVGLGRR